MLLIHEDFRADARRLGQEVIDHTKQCIAKPNEDSPIGLDRAHLGKIRSFDDSEAAKG